MCSQERRLALVNTTCFPYVKQGPQRLLSFFFLLYLLCNKLLVSLDPHNIEVVFSLWAAIGETTFWKQRLNSFHFLTCLTRTSINRMDHSANFSKTLYLLRLKRKYCCERFFTHLSFLEKLEGTLKWIKWNEMTQNMLHVWDLQWSVVIKATSSVAVRQKMMILWFSELIWQVIQLHSR